MKNSMLLFSLSLFVAMNYYAADLKEIQKNVAWQNGYTIYQSAIELCNNSRAQCIKGCLFLSSGYVIGYFDLCPHTIVPKASCLIVGSAMVSGVVHNYVSNFYKKDEVLLAVKKTSKAVNLSEQEILQSFKAAYQNKYALPDGMKRD